MTSQNCSLQADSRFSNAATKMTPLKAGSLVVRLLTGEEVERLSGLDKIPFLDRSKRMFVVFDETEADSSPLALCTITDTSDIGKGACFETAGHFSSDALTLAFPRLRFLETGEFHIMNQAKAHRAQGLLWHAIAAYCESHNIDYLFGAFSFEGRYPAAYALELSYLHHYHLIESALRVGAVDGVSMDIMPQEAIRPNEAFAFLPPLLRYCLRMGGKVGDGVAIDRDRNAVRIFMIMSAQEISRLTF